MFQGRISNLVGVNQYSFNIPFSELSINSSTFCNADVIVAASAVVTRTVAGSGGGKSDKSGKSGKSGQSDQSAKSSKGSSKVAAKGKSNKSGKSGQSGKSGKSGKSGSGSGPVTETLTVWAGDTSVGNVTYFSFRNDFCGPVKPPVITLPDAACYNVFAGGDGTVGASVPFSPTGLATPFTGWINTFKVTDLGLGAPVRNASGSIVGSLTAQLTSEGAVQVDFSDSINPQVYRSNIYIGAAGSFVNVSPLLYGTSSARPDAANVLVNLPATSATELDIVVHAILCPAGVQYNFMS